MGKHDVNILIKARDQASKILGKTTKGTDRLTASLKRAAGAAAAFFGARAIKRFATDSLNLFGRQETAVNDLSAALDLLGKNSSETLKDMQKFASSIQQITIHGDEAVLELLAMGASMGKLAGKELQDATKAAIGLAKAFKLDVVAAMRLVARAAQGDTGSLSRYGITLDKTLDKQEKFNRVLEIGISNFRLAEAETDTYLGKMIQMGNAVDDVKETIGGQLAPVIKEIADAIKIWAEDSNSNVEQWARNTVLNLSKVADGVFGLKAAFAGLGLVVAKELFRMEAIVEKIHKDQIERGAARAEKDGQVVIANLLRKQLDKQLAGGALEAIEKEREKFAKLLFDTVLPSDKIAAIFKESKFGAGGGTGGAAGGDGAGAAAGGRNVRQQLRAREARQLTFAPGARAAPEEQTAKNTAETVKGINRLIQGFENLADRFSDTAPSGQPQALTVSAMR